ncbi:hypothetical protein SNEBB_008920 [Seison nebaliae]|nr:hypothetical protein SNEBB_008920 [Seison nebaliae]
MIPPSFSAMDVNQLTHMFEKVNWEGRQFSSSFNPSYNSFSPNWIDKYAYNYSETMKDDQIRIMGNSDHLFQRLSLRDDASFERQSFINYSDGQDNSDQCRLLNYLKEDKLCGGENGNIRCRETKRCRHHAGDGISIKQKIKEENLPYWLLKASSENQAEDVRNYDEKRKSTEQKSKDSKCHNHLPQRKNKSQENLPSSSRKQLSSNNRNNNLGKSRSNGRTFNGTSNKRKKKSSTSNSVPLLSTLDDCCSRSKSSTRKSWKNKTFSCSSTTSNLSSSTSTSTIDDDKRELYKTELCRSFEETGLCKYGNRCKFAHGMSELRQVADRHAKYKTVPCTTFHQSGYCPYGKRCHFVHSLTELRRSSIQRKIVNKSQMSSMTQIIGEKLEKPEESLYIRHLKHFPSLIDA